MQAAAAHDSKVTFRTLLSNPNYRYLILSQFVSNIGDGVYRLALIWLMKILTESPFLMSILLAAEIIPLIIFGVFAGVLVDRGSKKKIMVLSDVFRGALLVMLVILLINDALQPYMLIVIAVLLTSLSAFFKPAVTVTIRTLVSEEQMTAAQSLSQIIQTIVGLAAPALAAFLIFFGMEMAFIFNILTYALSLLFILFIRNQELEVSNIGDLTMRKVLDDLKDGIQAITGNPFLKNCLIYFTIINFLMAPEALLLPIIVPSVSHLATLETSLFVGVLAGSICINYLRRYTPIVYICLGICMFSCATGAFFFGIPLYIQVVCLFLGGVGSALVNIKVSTLLTVIVPKDVLGRASSLINVIVLCAMPASTFLTGVISGYIPILTIFGVIGLLGLVVVVFMMFNPHLRGHQEALKASAPEQPSQSAS